MNFLKKKYEIKIAEACQFKKNSTEDFEGTTSTSMNS
jgi:hypothetical protein